MAKKTTMYGSRTCHGKSGELFLLVFGLNLEVKMIELPIGRLCEG